MTMHNVLEELFYGNLNPGYKQMVHGSEFAKATKAVSDSEERVCKLLDDKDKELFAKMTAARGKLNGLTACEYFIEGFRLGARIGLAVMSDDTENLKSITD